MIELEIERQRINNWIYYQEYNHTWLWKYKGIHNATRQT